MAVATDFDLERIIPDRLSADPFERETFEVHAARYRYAARWVAGKRVLDLACGVGYGSAILKDAGASHVTGVDLSADAIAYARQRYARPGIEHVVADGMAFQPAALFDVVVSLETIEHVPDARGFVRRLGSFVAPGGLLVGSVPTTLSTDVNPYHVHDFTRDELAALFAEAGVTVIDEMTQAQPYSPIRLRSLARSSAGRKYQLRPNLLHYYASHPRALARRLWTTVRHGFVNEYVVLVGRKS